MKADFQRNVAEFHGSQVEIAGDMSSVFVRFKQASSETDGWTGTIYTTAQGLCQTIAGLPRHVPGVEEAVMALAEKWAEDADLAECVVKGVRQDAELLRKAVRAARIDECRLLKQRRFAVRYSYPRDGKEERLAQVIPGRIRELEAEGEDDANDSLDSDAVPNE